MTSEELLKSANVERIASEGQRIYEEIKSQFEPEFIGKFLAIDIGSKKYYLADSSSEAVEKARHAHPETIFYVVKIGFSVAETLARMERV